MSSNIGDPFLLASYPVPSKTGNVKAWKSVRDKCSLVYVAYSHLHGNSSADGQVTIAAQGEGVHVLDIASLRPAASHTLGPSTTFACPPCTTFTSHGEKTIRRTFVAIDNAPDISEEDRGRVMWSWEDVVTDDLGSSSQAKKTFKANHRVSQLFCPAELRSDLLIFSPDGELTWTSPDFQVRKQWSPPQPSPKILKTFLFPRSASQFAPSAIVPQNGVLVVNFACGTGKLQIHIIALGQDGELVTLETASISVDPDIIADISCDPSGHSSILTHDGSWHPCRIEVLAGKLIVSQQTGAIQLHGLSFISGDQLATPSPMSEQVSLLSLGSSHVLMAGITTSTVPEIALLVWDVQYLVILDSQMLPVPSTLPNASPANLTVSLTRGSSSQALLILTPNASSDSNLKVSAHYRSSVLVVPCNVPSTSTIANALGRASQSSKWLVDANLQKLDPSSSGKPAPSAAACDQMLKCLHLAMVEEEIESANTIFFDWIAAESAKLKSNAHTQDEQAMELDGAEVKADGQPNHPDSKGKLKARHDPKVPFSHSLTSSVLRIILPSADRDSPSVGYPSKILRYLLERQVVSHSMVDSGLLHAVSFYHDWDNIHLILRNVIDVPEAEIVRVLRDVVGTHRQPTKTPTIDPDAMSVDAPPDTPKVPTLPVFLHTCVDYPTSAPALRKAFRERFRDPSDLLSVLEVLARWIAQWSTKDIKIPFDEAFVNDQGIGQVRPSKSKSSRRKDGMPNLDNIATFIQVILDSCFLSLLQHNPSHNTLKAIASHLEPFVAFGDQLEHLRGPLEPFVKAQSKALSDARGDRRKDATSDWRHRRKQDQNQNGIVIGLYQLEELVF